MRYTQENNKITVVYVRVSTDDQAELGHSLDYQLLACKSYCTQHNLSNILEFIDDGYSATSLKRPGMSKILQMIRQDQVSDLVVYDVDRLSRNVADSVEIYNLAKSKGVTIHSVNFNTPFSTADGRFMTIVKFGISQFESEKISERTINGIIGGLEKGKFSLAHPPFGYRRYKNKDNEDDPLNGTLIANADELEIVERIFRMYTEILINTRQIAFVIQNDTGIKFMSNKVCNILRSECYTGVYEYRGKLYNNLGFVPIITKERFEVAQARLDHHFKSKKYDYLFYKKLICSCCGTILKSTCTNKNGDVYLYYCCSNNDCKCKGKLISEKKVIKLLEKDIIRLYNKHNFTFHNPKAKVQTVKSLAEIERPDLVRFIVEHFKQVIINVVTGEIVRKRK